MASELASGLTATAGSGGIPTIIHCSMAFFKQSEHPLYHFAKAFCTHNHSSPAVCTKSLIERMYQSELQFVFGLDQDSINKFSQDTKVNLSLIRLVPVFLICHTLTDHH